MLAGKQRDDCLLPGSEPTSLALSGGSLKRTDFWQWKRVCGMDFANALDKGHCGGTKV